MYVCISLFSIQQLQSQNGKPCASYMMTMLKIEKSQTPEHLSMTLLKLIKTERNAKQKFPKRPKHTTKPIVTDLISKFPYTTCPTSDIISIS